VRSGEGEGLLAAAKRGEDPKNGQRESMRDRNPGRFFSRVRRATD